MSLPSSSFEGQIETLDPALFSTIPSQSTPNDQRSLLALHAAFRRVRGSFRYLEIGSHLGGSMQAMVADPACISIISIDPRPTAFADERGIISEYPSNSTDRMLQHLAVVPGADLSKIQTIELSTVQITAATISPKPDFCFIDAEHTTTACLRDARFCCEALNGDGVIAFHDANVVYAGIDKFLAGLTAEGRSFRAYLLPDAVFVVELGDVKLLDDPKVSECYMNSWRGYLFALRAMEWYRAALNKPLFRFLRRTRFVRRLFIVKES